jgi:uncharacterized membrane protein YdjX (TVP38/TMEM64 family)
MSPSRARKVAALAAMAGGVAAFHASGLHERLTWEWVSTHRDAARAWADARPLAAAAGFVALYVAVAGLSIPVGWVLTVAGGALFGMVWGGLLVSFAATAGATLAFAAWRYVFRDFARRKVARGIDAFDRGLARNGALFVVLLRLTPLVPYFAVNAGMALTRLPARTFWWATQLGMLPVTLLYLYVGTRLGQIESPGEVLSPAVVAAFAALGVLPLVGRRFRAGPDRRPGVTGTGSESAIAARPRAG